MVHLCNCICVRLYIVHCIQYIITFCRKQKESHTGFNFESGNLLIFSERNQPTGVDCVINQEYSVSCMQDGDEVYVPFSFLHDYFEVFGSLSTIGKGPAKFEWSHSNAKVNYPKEIYDPKGIFMYFENYNVEVSKFF